MDGDAGPRVAAVHGSFYTGRPFQQYQFFSNKGLGTAFGSKNEFLNSNSGPFFKANSSEAREKDRNVWEGFSFMTGPENRIVSSTRDTSNGNISGTGMPHARNSAGLRVESEVWDPESEPHSAEHRRKQTLFKTTDLNVDAGGLSLKLCSDATPQSEDAGNCSRNNKRFRPSSPGNQNHVCQVDDCHADLKSAKDYHRRHRVCELHSKAPQCIVHKILQRFCQQCSRFHPLEEFDEGKRSCRRRLAGHNRRRRKSNADNGVPSSDNTGGRDLLNVVTLLSQFQAKTKENPDTPSPEQQAAFLSLKKAAFIKDVTLAIYQNLQSQRPDQISQAPLSQLGHLPQDGLALALRNILGAQASGVQGNTQHLSTPHQNSINERVIQSLSSLGQSNVQDRTRAANGAVECLPLNLSGKVFSTPVESEPVSSPERNCAKSPTEQNFFPTESHGKLREDAALKTNGHDCASESHRQVEYNDFPIFRQHHKVASVAHKSIRQPTDTSESGSDQSPASSSSGSQELSGRIIFKLCDPTRIADIPRDYKSQLQEWLSVTPCFMEEYMRPGCILLTVFLLMPRSSWAEMTLDLRGSLKRLLQLSHTDLWRKGRIFVQVGQQRATIVDGEVKRVRYSRIGNAPFIRSVRPVAVIAGEEAMLTIHGYNLFPETKIVCVYHGMHVLHKVSVPTSTESNEAHDNYVQQVRFPGGPPNVFGRCFIEVEHNLLGNTLPVIVANREICFELRSLERELDTVEEGFSSDEAGVSKEMEAMEFLQELGWIFQSTSVGIGSLDSIMGQTSHVNLSRFKGLLKYAVLHDWCALVKKLLDILFSIGISEFENVLKLLAEVNLVHKAVKRKCNAMVELLLHYAPDGYGTNDSNVFSPVMKGPAGLTPLHVAANMVGAEEVLEALTDDPYEVGLNGWRSVHDFEGLTPEQHAENRGNVSYVKLMERKMMNKMSRYVNIQVHDQSSKVLTTKDRNAEEACEGNTVRRDSLILELAEFSVSGPDVMCKHCKAFTRMSLTGAHMKMHRPLLMMMVAVAALCATVAVFFKTPPHLESVLYSLKWEGISYGPS